MHVAGTEPYAWPFDGNLDGARLALVLPGWDETWAGRGIEVDAALGVCAGLAATISAAGGLVIAIAHRGAPSLAPPVPSAVSVPADGIDGFYGGPLDPTLRRLGRSRLIVAGIGLEGPVHSTLRSANDRGYECLLVADACASLDSDLTAAAALTVTMSGGIFGAVGTADATAAALTAGTPSPPSTTTQTSRSNDVLRTC